ncbi:hypothetical protein ACFVAE_14765 [Microbacterium sp. NPDC057659]|uniref:hypothetical protein n=1 Tax=Microbacterium sp. NPDC057659 TaxID=3346198 RepID=UPI0036709789
MTDKPDEPSQPDQPDDAPQTDGAAADGEVDLPEPEAPDAAERPPTPWDPAQGLPSAPPPAASSPEPYNPAGTRKPGPGMGAGFGIGCAAYVLGIPIMLASLSATAAAGALGVLWPFIVILVISALLMISERTRRVGAGMLIASAAAWIIVIGPCIGLLGGFG